MIPDRNETAPRRLLFLRHLVDLIWRWQVATFLSPSDRIKGAVRGLLHLVVVGALRLCHDIP